MAIVVKMVVAVVVQNTGEQAKKRAYQNNNSSEQYYDAKVQNNVDNIEAESLTLVLLVEWSVVAVVMVAV